MKFLSVLLLVSVIAFVSGVQRIEENSHTQFAGHRVLRFHLNTEPELHILRNLIDEHNLDMWSHQLHVGDIDVRVPEGFDMEGIALTYTVVHSDLAETIKAATELQTRSQTDLPEDDVFTESSPMATFFTAYRDYDEFNAFLKSVVANYSNLAKTITIGRTFEGRDINGLVISAGINGNTSTKIGVFYNALQHAREWVGPMTVAWTIQQLVSQYGVDDQITRLMDKIEWTIVPIINVDGYIFTKTNRMWRKNRKPGRNNCIGTDINRNWGYQWNKGGASNNPCAEDYCGTAEFSEPENKAIADWIAAHKNIQGYIDFHAFSQLWMSPWGYSPALPADDATQKELGRAAAAAIAGVHGKQFDVGNINTIIYPASGSSTDWAYGAGNVKWAYGVELRDKGQFGFLLPANQIIPSGEEIFAAVRVMGDYIINHQ